MLVPIDVDSSRKKYISKPSQNSNINIEKKKSKGEKQLRNESKMLQDL